MNTRLALIDPSKPIFTPWSHGLDESCDLGMTLNVATQNMYKIRHFHTWVSLAKVF